MRLRQEDLSRWLAAVQVSEDSREAEYMRLRYVEQVPDAEIAAALGVEEVTVRASCSETWAKIRTLEKRQDGDRVTLTDILRLLVFQIDSSLDEGEFAPEVREELLSARAYAQVLIRLLKGPGGPGVGGEKAPLRDPLVSVGDVETIVRDLAAVRRCQRAQC